MKKKLFALLMSFLFSPLLQAQFNVLEFEKIAKGKTIEKKCDALSKEGFIKESNSPIRMIKKKFDKKQQITFEEIVAVSQDTVIYSFTDPKKYIDFKVHVDAYYKKVPFTDGTDRILYVQKHKEYILYETDEKRDNETVRLYNFKFYLKNKD